jgi:hypothetical protein
VFPQLFFEPIFEKIEAHFFRKFLHLPFKNSYFLIGVQIKQKRSYEALICSELAFKKVQVNLEIKPRRR